MQWIKHITKVLLLIFILVGCDTNKFDVDIEESKVELKLKRLDTDFFKAQPDDLEVVNQQLIKKYGRFYKIYLQQILRIGIAEDPAVSYSIKSFLTDKYVQDLALSVDSVYPNLDNEMKALSNAFSYYKYHFPNRYIPDVVTAISGFSTNVAVTDSVLGVCLDLYLGSDNVYYKKAGIPAYKLPYMTKENIPYDAMKGWVSSEMSSDFKKRDLLTAIVKEGIVLYCMDAMFPAAPDHMKIGYSKEEIEWCEANSFQIWSKMIEDNYLYTTHPAKIRRFIGEGPNTAGFPKDSPSKVGHWIGWQMVREYMERYPDTTLEELMNINDAQILLQKSKYKPGN